MSQSESSSSSQPVSFFERIFDTIVYGSGYTAFAAAMELHRAGRDVLLVHRLSDIVWESGRSLAQDTGELDAAPWRDWLAALSQCGGMPHPDHDQIDGAVAEVTATSLMKDAGLPVLYYVTPLAVETMGGALQAVVVGTKAEPRRLVARQWIDASETGEICRLIDQAAQPRQPDQLAWRAIFQHDNWIDAPGSPGSSANPDRDLPETQGAALRWERGIWPTERCLTLTLSGDTASGEGGGRPQRAVLPALKTLHDTLPEVMQGAVLSHCSVDALPIYDGPASASAGFAVNTMSNVVCASPALHQRAVRTLADRFGLGLEAVAALDDRALHEVDTSLISAPIDLESVQPTECIEDEVIVAGAGTGGAMAAIAAGRSGASVTCIEPMPFAGGIGSGGGIHHYYFGIAGGLQEEVDQRTEAVMPLFGKRAQVRGFHPDAKKLILEQMMEEAGVRFLPHTMLSSVQRDGRSITSALAGTAQGPVELRGKAWVDATGDGDLCAMAGAAFHIGRTGDGNFHAYSQSSGRLQHTDHGIAMGMVNYDSGWVDPTDSQDLTRARIVGIDHYRRDHYTQDNRPTYIAPAIGLRQGRQIETDYVLSLTDLIERSQFPDAIGFTGAHYDNHAVDYEFESDEAVFWVWALRQWRAGRTACQMPYRMIVPRDLDNAWLACRAIGVSPDAHHSCRMQRDIQRVGEAAGYAAALALQHNTDARALPFTELRQRLVATDAIDLSKIDIDRQFGPYGPSEEFYDPQAEQFLAEGLERLRAGEPHHRIWYVYRAGERVRDDVLACLNDANPMVSWLAASVLAAWGDGRAESRLIEAVQQHEYGYENVSKAADQPENNRRLVPHWLTAVSLLRCCGSKQCLPALQSLAEASSLALHTRTAIALTLERLAQRGVAMEPAWVQSICEALLREPIPDSFVVPQHNITCMMQEGQANDTTDQPTAEDHRWQVHLAVARARLAVGLEPQPEAEGFRTDERSIVRRAFARLQVAATA